MSEFQVPEEFRGQPDEIVLPCHICGEDAKHCGDDGNGIMHDHLENEWVAVTANEVVEGYLSGRLQ